MKRFLPIRKIAAWLCLAVILFGSGGAQLLHAIPGLGHHDHHCCHGHSHSCERAHKHSHSGHGHGQTDHCHPPAKHDDTSNRLSGNRWTQGHHCVLCEIIAVLHQGALLVDSPEVSSDLFREPFFLCEASPQKCQLLGLPSPRGPPIS